MVTFIEIMDGPDKGSRFQIKDSLTIGRARADILINDPKISSTHAQFMIDEKGHFNLLDLNSSNGIIINGLRVKKVSLLQGVTFEIGRTQFKVILVDEETAIDFAGPISWRDHIKKFFVAEEKDKSYKVRPVRSFDPPVKLTFIQGIQSDVEITLGYGPRTAGADSLDIELLDDLAPKEAFELLPQATLAQIKVKSPRIKVNGKTTDADILHEGDLISFGKTLIKVSYL